MCMLTRFIWLSASVWLSAAGAAAAAERLRLNTTTAAPTIDGHLEPAEWQAADRFDGFVQIEPLLNAQPSESTRLYLLRDQNFLYIGIALQQRAKLIAREWVQDADLHGDDHITVLLDPFSSKDKGYAFSVNPNGARSEALIADGDDFDEDWEDLWYAAAGPSADGWQVEMAIPFRSLSFPKDRQQWLINVSRRIAERNETVALNSRKRRLDLSAGLPIDGFGGVTAASGLLLTTNSTLRLTRNLDTDKEDLELRPSADLFYKLTPSLTAALTLNTDFAAAEVDQRELNLTRFELFFPERRDFFLRDANLFTFGGLEENGLPYFSRRIGLGLEGEPLDIRVGSKLTGQVDRWSIGVMAVNQDIEEGRGQQTLGVARLRADLSERSSVGMIGTYGEPVEGRGDQLYGFDYRYANEEVAGDNELEVFAWWQRVQLAEPGNDDQAFGFSAEWPNETIEASVAYANIGSDFAPPLGFVNRNGISDWSAEGRYRFRPELALIRTIDVGVDGRWVSDSDGLLETRQFDFSLIELGGAAGDVLELQWIRSYERLSEPFEIADDLEVEPGRYYDDRYVIEFESASQRDLQVLLSYENGPFLGGHLRSVESSLVIRPSARLSLGLDYEYDRLAFGDDRRSLRLARLLARYSFDSAWSLTTLVQYDNESHELGLNSRLRWTPSAGQEHFLVLNLGRTREEDASRYRTQTVESLLRLSFSFLF